MSFYLLYGGQSEDGSGWGEYKTYTTDPDEARTFYLDHIYDNPYSTGKVVKVTKESMDEVRWEPTK